MSSCLPSHIRTDLSVRRETRSSHVGAADGFNLLHLLEITFVQQLHGEKNADVVFVWVIVFSCVCVCVYDLIEVGDDVVEEAETLDGLMNELLLLVEVGETRQRGEENADSLVRLRVQLLKTHTQSTAGYTHTHTHLLTGSRYLVAAVSLQEVLGDMGRQDVEQQTLVVLPQLLHVLHLLPRLKTPQEVQPRSRLQLPTKKNNERTMMVKIKSKF